MGRESERVIDCPCGQRLTTIEGEPPRIPTTVRIDVRTDEELAAAGVAGRAPRGQAPQFGRVRWSEARDAWRVTCSQRRCNKGWIFERGEVETAKGDRLIAGFHIGRPVGS